MVEFIIKSVTEVVKRSKSHIIGNIWGTKKYLFERLF